MRQIVCLVWEGDEGAQFQLLVFESSARRRVFQEARISARDKRIEILPTPEAHNVQALRKVPRKQQAIGEEPRSPACNLLSER